jgi:glutaredoxin
MYVVLGHSQCRYCKDAIQLLATRGRSFTYLDAHSPHQADLLAQVKAEGYTTVPQIWKDNVRVGGFEDLQKTLS